MCTFVNSFANTIKIKVKISDKIITNIDIENEKKYLIFLNPKLEELEKSKVDNIAKDSLITEIIKKNELEKFLGHGNPYTLSYQSRVGPVEWLKPYTCLLYTSDAADE